MVLSWCSSSTFSPHCFVSLFLTPPLSSLLTSPLLNPFTWFASLPHSSSVIQGHQGWEGAIGKMENGPDAALLSTSGQLLNLHNGISCCLLFVYFAQQRSSFIIHSQARTHTHIVSHTVGQTHGHTHMRTDAFKQTTQRHTNMNKPKLT